MLCSAQLTDCGGVDNKSLWGELERSRISVYPSIVAASGSSSMGCVGILTREGGTAPTRNVEENRGPGVRSSQVLRGDWVGRGWLREGADLFSSWPASSGTSDIDEQARKVVSLSWFPHPHKSLVPWHT